MNLTAIAIKYNRVTAIVLLIITLMGVLAYNQLARDSMPPFTIRVASVVTSFPGAGPERVEELVTDKIEKVIQEIPEVDFINSESRTGLSIITISLKDEIKAENLRPVWDKMRRKVESVQSELPSTANPSEVKDDNIGVVFGVILGLENDGFEYNELKDYADDIRDELIKLEDAAQVNIGGINDERVYIEYDNAELTKYGLSSSQLKNIIAGTNILFSGGEISLGDERVILEPTGNFENLEDLKRTIIPLGNGKTVFLDDISTIYKDYISPRKSIVKLNGEDGLSIAIALKEGANVISLGEQVDIKLSQLNKDLPVGLHLRRIASQDLEVDKSVNDFIENLIQSVIIVLIVMLVFLGFRTGIVVASLIPAAMIFTIFLMDLFGVGLNQVSLAALIMALGMLVDNAIVIAESIMVKMEKGEKAKDAAISSAQELMIPLLISSLTTSAAFLSFFLAESVMGDIVGPLFTVITMALLSSWLLSLTLVAMLAILLIRIKKKHPEEEEKPTVFDKINVYYQALLKKSLRYPIAFVLIIIALFFGSLSQFSRLPFIFMPDSERNLVTVDLNLPLGTKIETTEASISLIEKFISDSLLVNDSRSKGVLDWSNFIAEGPESYDLGYSAGEANSGYAHLLINTSSGADNQYVIEKLDHFCYNNLPDAEVKVKRLGSGGGGGTPVEVRITGKSPLELVAISDKIKQQLVNISGTKTISDDWGPKIKKLVININQTKAQKAGLSNQDIALSLKTVLSGYNTGEFREGDNSIPIIMRNNDSQELDIQSLETLNIFAQNSGKSVPLIQVADIETEWQFAKIKRRDLSRTMTIGAYVKEGTTAQDVTAILQPWMEEYEKEWKSGYAYELGGDAESSNDAMGAVIEKLPLSGFIILILLILQFNSVRKTFLVISTIPLGLIGVIFGLILANSYFSFFGFLGVISLAGIVINNAIVLIDRIQTEIDEFNRAPYDAIIHAAGHRFRPILLTTATTTLGLLPLWFGGGLMWEPLAIGIIFGLLFATVITLLFIPVVYSLLFRVKRKTT